MYVMKCEESPASDHEEMDVSEHTQPDGTERECLMCGRPTRWHVCFDCARFSRTPSSPLDAVHAGADAPPGSPRPRRPLCS